MVLGLYPSRREAATRCGLGVATVCAILQAWFACPCAADDSTADSWFRPAVEAGHIQGLRELDLIRNDVVAVTVDAAITQTGDGMGPADAFQQPQAFTLYSLNDPRYARGVHPSSVGRKSFPRFNGVAHGPLFTRRLWWHTYYLYLPQPLQSGCEYRITVKGIAPPFRSETVLKYDDRSTTSKAIKINQVGYCSLAKRRYAYLGWWAGDKGKVDYSVFKSFAVIDEDTNRTVLTDSIRLRQADDELSGEDVYEMDISGLGPGRYHIRIPDLARSETFHVGGAPMRDLYYHTTRAFFHQRCGQELGLPCTWVTKPACHVECWQSGRLVDGPGKIICLWKKKETYTPQSGEEKRSFRGGYHDAADFDTFAYHLPATAQMLDAYELFPAAFKDGDLDILESSNGVPDVLDEAEWGLSFYKDNQYESGAVPLSRGNECDAFEQNTDGKLTTFGVLPPRRNSSETYGAVAARFARLIRKFDEAKANDFLESARRAYAWARQNPPAPNDHKSAKDSWKPFLSWAATELFRAGGDSRYHEDFKRDYEEKAVTYWNRSNLRWWPYVTADRSRIDADICKDLRSSLIASADRNIEKTDLPAYRSSAGRPEGCGWGSCNPCSFTDALLRAYGLTGEQKYLDSASLNADWLLGCNPLSQTFVTSMGVRFPNRPEISWFLFEGPDMTGKIVKGITIYGVKNPINDWYPKSIPMWRSHLDTWGFGAEISSEFTLHQTIGPTAMLFQCLYALERLQGSLR